MALTIRDIARLAGVSIGTVSNVLNGQPKIAPATREKILKVIREVGYTPNIHARRLQKGKSGCIGILFSPFVSNTIVDSYYLKIFCEMNKAVQEKGHTLVYSYISQQMIQSRTFPEFVQSRSVDGLIILNYIQNRDYLYEMKRLGFPIVLIDDVLDSPGFTWIYPDYKKGTRELMQYLVGLGHRDIGLIDGPIEYIFNRDRYDGYQEILTEKGIRGGRELLEYVEEFSLEAGYQAARRLLGRERGITAIFCACDDLAIGALRAAQEMKYRVPQDLSIIGFDDLEVSQYLNPPLTTVRTPRETVGKLAIEVITRQVGLRDRDEASGKFIIPVELVIRGSCAAPNPGDPRHKP